MINKSKYIIQILFASFFISFLLYNRLFIARLPKNLFIFENGLIKWNIVIVIILGISIALYMIIQNIFKMINYFNKSPQIFHKILIFIETSLQELHILIVSYIPDNYEKISYLSQKFYTMFEKKSETFFLFILFFIRFVILFAFITDVFFYFELYFMYKTLYLLCISLLIRFWFSILTDFSSNLEEIQSALIIEDRGTDPITSLPITFFSFKKEFNTFDLKYHVEQYFLCSKLSGYLENYNRYKTFFTPYINILIYSLYLIGWLYVLYVNLILL